MLEIQVKPADSTANTNGRSLPLLPSPSKPSGASVSVSPTPPASCSVLGDEASSAGCCIPPFEPAVGCCAVSPQAPFRDGSGPDGGSGLCGGACPLALFPAAVPESPFGALCGVSEGSENEPVGPQSQCPSGLEPWESTSVARSRRSLHAVLGFGEERGQDSSATQVHTVRLRRTYGSSRAVCHPSAAVALAAGNIDGGGVGDGAICYPPAANATATGGAEKSCGDRESEGDGWGLDDDAFLEMQSGISGRNVPGRDAGGIYPFGMLPQVGDAYGGVERSPGREIKGGGKGGMNPIIPLVGGLVDGVQPTGGAQGRAEDEDVRNLQEGFCCPITQVIKVSRHP